MIAGRYTEFNFSFSSQSSNLGSIATCIDNWFFATLPSTVWKCDGIHSTRNEFFIRSLWGLSAWNCYKILPSRWDLYFCFDIPAFGCSAMRMLQLVRGCLLWMLIMRIIEHYVNQTVHHHLLLCGIFLSVQVSVFTDHVTI